MIYYDVGVPLSNISPRASWLSPPVVSVLGQAYGSNSSAVFQQRRCPFRFSMTLGVWPFFCVLLLLIPSIACVHLGHGDMVQEMEPKLNVCQKWRPRNYGRASRLLIFSEVWGWVPCTIISSLCFGLRRLGRGRTLQQNRKIQNFSWVSRTKSSRKPWKTLRGPSLGFLATAFHRFAWTD